MSKKRVYCLLEGSTGLDGAARAVGSLSLSVCPGGEGTLRYGWSFRPGLERKLRSVSGDRSSSGFSSRIIWSIDFPVPPALSLTHRVFSLEVGDGFSTSVTSVTSAGVKSTSLPSSGCREPLYRDVCAMNED